MAKRKMVFIIPGYLAGYEYDIKIGDRVHVPKLGWEGELRFIEGIPTEKRGHAKAWLDLFPGAESDYRYFTWRDEKGKQYTSALNICEFLDVEKGPLP